MLRLDKLENENKTIIPEDPISRAIITRALSKKSIRVSNLPLDRLPTISTLIRLYLLEELGFLKSTIEYKKDSCERVFSPTQRIRQILTSTPML